MEMDKQSKTIEKERIPDFVNLEEYRNLLGQLKHLKDIKKLSKVTLSIELEIPELLVETMKILAAFNDLSFEQSTKRLVLDSFASDIECYLGNTTFYEALHKLAQEIEY
ncbi:MAG: hypothetical protein ACTSQE_14525 [Candidatus Heimdallarchaeaceae archaeon]